MKTVKELIKELRKFPMDSKVHAYEGEITGVVITHATKSYTELGYVPVTARAGDDGEAVIYSKKKGA